MEKAISPFTDALKPLLATGYEKNPPKAVGSHSFTCGLPEI